MGQLTVAFEKIKKEQLQSYIQNNTLHVDFGQNQN